MANHITLRGRSGSIQGMTWTAETRLRIGRNRRHEVIIPDIWVSRCHAEVEFLDGCWQLQDCGSRNGTSHNRAPFQAPERRLLQRGDTIQICGVAVLEVESLSPDPAPILEPSPSLLFDEPAHTAYISHTELLLRSLRRMLVSPRKVRLFAAACCRVEWSKPPAEPFDVLAEIPKRAVAVAEQYADGLATDQELAEALRSIEQRSPGLAHIACLADPIQGFCHHQVFGLQHLPMLDDIAGSLHLRPIPLEPSWLGHENAAVVRLARTIEQEQDYSLLPILGDALEDAGCDNAAMLDHCRKPRPHWRGCWLIDLLTGKN